MLPNGTIELAQRLVATKDKPAEFSKVAADVHQLSDDHVIAVWASAIAIDIAVTDRPEFLDYVARYRKHFFLDAPRRAEFESIVKAAQAAVEALRSGN